MRAALAVPLVQMTQLHAQNRSLHSIKTTVHAFHLVRVLFEPPVVREHAHVLHQIFILADDRTRITKSTEILSRIKTESCCIADRTHALTAPTSTVRLCCVFDDFQSMLASDLHDRIHVARLAVKMNGYDRFGPRRNCGFDL